MEILSRIISTCLFQMSAVASLCQHIVCDAFQDCFKVLPAGELENRLVSCKFDLCMVEPSSRMPMYCTHADDLTQRCSDLGNPVETWRSESLCRKSTRRSYRFTILSHVHHKSTLLAHFEGIHFNPAMIDNFP